MRHGLKTLTVAQKTAKIREDAESVLAKYLVGATITRKVSPLWWHLHGVEPRKVYTTPSVKQVLDNKVYKVLRTNSGFNGSYNTRIITISEAFNIGVKLNQRS